jgi:transcription antitermination factor NusG
VFWHIIRTRFGFENVLSWDGVMTLVPLERVHRPVPRPWLPSIILRPLFSGYLFAYWETSDFNLWHEINETTGVIEILGGESPWPVPAHDIEKWRARMDDDGVVPDLKRTLDEIAAGFSADDTVEFTYASWVAQRGVCLGLDRVTAKVEIACLGRRIAIRVPVTCCVRVDGDDLRDGALGKSRRSRGGISARKVKDLRRRLLDPDYFSGIEVVSFSRDRSSSHDRQAVPERLAGAGDGEDRRPMSRPVEPLVRGEPGSLHG